MTRQTYAMGDSFAIPLLDGGYAVGLIARANKAGVLFGYFFGPRRPDLPSGEGLMGLAPESAVLVLMFGHLGIAEGRWPLLGRLKDWEPRDWPLPAFVRHEELTGRSFRVFYADDDPNRVLREEEIPIGESVEGPPDALYGPALVEDMLTELLQRRAH